MRKRKRPNLTAVVDWERMLSSEAEENPSISVREDGACYRIPSLRNKPGGV